MIDIAALKNRILALAVNGQVANNKKDVKQLYDSLCDNAYKIDKNKVSDKNYDLSELPFEIPDNWKWVWLGDIFQHNTGKALNSSNTEGTPLEYITTSNLYWDRFELEELKTMLFKDSEMEKCTVRKGDLLICEGGDIGRSAIWSEDYEMRIQNHIHSLRPYVEDICVRFYYYVMMYYKNNGLISGRGIGLQGLSSKRLHSILVPLPDIETQYLIAERIDESFSVIDTIDELQQQYSANIEVLKSKIIDAGIHGKLTEQLPEDGTAEELLEQIAEEKKMHVKEGKIKASKSLPEITEDEIPFEIPDNWKWCRLVDLCKEITDGTHKTPTYIETGVPFLSVKNVSSGHFDFEDVKYISESEHRELIKRCNPEKGDILICRIGTLGKAIEIDINVDFSIFVSLGLIKPLDSYLSKYLVYVLNSGFGEKWIKKNKAGDAMHAAKINLDVLRSFLVPLPPLLEQTRIVDKIDEMLSIVQR